MTLSNYVSLCSLFDLIVVLNVYFPVWELKIFFPRNIHVNKGSKSYVCS